MPKRINPQDQWETDFQVPLPGEPRNIGPLETLFQRLLNRTERLKNRIGAILGTAWDATPPATLAGLAGRVSTLESNQGGTTLSAHRSASVLDHPDGSVTAPKLANGAVTLQKLASTAFSADPTPNTLALRNAQGALQDGAKQGSLKVIRIAGIYTWSETNKWLRLAQWTGFTGNHKGLWADLYIRQLEAGTLGTRLRVRLRSDGSGAYSNPIISIAHELNSAITDAALIQTENDTLELWAFFPYGYVHVEGAVAASIGSVNLTPYGNVSALAQGSPPNPIPGGIYLKWSDAAANQTFPGPGNIVAASRNASSGYIRYDNGIQVCWGIASVGNGTWAFPAAFASPPQVQATAETANATPRVVTLTAVSPTAVAILRTDLSGNVQSGTVHLYAIGLWK